MPDRLIALRYALPIAMVPVVLVLGIGIGSLLSGVLTEIVFARPELGKLAFDSVISRNFPVVMGTVVVTSNLYVLAKLIADVMNTCLDPRVRVRSCDDRTVNAGRQLPGTERRHTAAHGPLSDAAAGLVDRDRSLHLYSYHYYFHVVSGYFRVVRS